MTIISAVPGGSGDPYAKLVQGLQMEFGSADIGALAKVVVDSWRGLPVERPFWSEQ